MTTLASRPAAAASPGDLTDEIARLGPWFHNVHLPDGTQTFPNHWFGDFPRFKWEQLSPHLPTDLSGWTALDIGCNSAFYAIELARRGARVTAIEHDEHFLRQAEFCVRRWGFEDRVTLRKQEVYDLAASAERYDLVLFMGVFYHLRYPLLALDLVADRVGKLLVFQTLQMPGTEPIDVPENANINDRDRMLDPGYPKMAFIEHRLNNDPTNWWAPNRAAVEAMLRSSGMRILSRPMDEAYLCQPNPHAHRAYNRAVFGGAGIKTRDPDGWSSRT